ncbi:MAG: DUF2135 domain-containing protein [Treponema sp.]|nr:DUF2135 domain-containing protein [Treponema sp.]
MKRLFSSFILILTAVCAFAQNKISPPVVITPVVPRPPRIIMTVPDVPKDSIKLSDLSVKVEVAGNVATTTYDMVFTNSSSKILEGEFEFPLGQGQTVVGYALDINGRMRQGVAVEKEKARTVFEDVVRKNVDPGLVELTSGNNFKTRVYPLPARGSRHVQITYEEVLPISGTNRTYVLQPLTDEKLSSFKFEISVYNLRNEPKIQSNSGFGSFNFDSQNTGYNASFERKDFTFDQPISITLPEDDGLNNVFMQDIGRDTYFYFYTSMRAASRQKTLPRSLTVYYDISSSMKNRNFKSEMELLRQYLYKLNNPSVTVIPFSNTLHEARTFNSNWMYYGAIDEIEAFLKQQKYDGGTSLDFIQNLSSSSDEILIFTDGISNWKNLSTGNNPFRYLGTKSLVYTINSSSSADHSFLKSLAQENGGMYVNLSQITSEQGLELLTKEYLHLIRADYDSSAVSDLLPGIGAVVEGDFSVSGILRGKSSPVTLSFGYGNTITEVNKFNVSLIGSVNSSGPQNIARLWAQKKIEDLNKNYDANRSQIIDLAKKFTIVTKDTSLLVLDNASDYVKYGIEPPEDLRAEYNRLVSNNRTKTAEPQGIPNSVFNKFEEFRNWWNKKPQDFKTGSKSKAKGSSSGSLRSSTSGAMYMDAMEMEAPMMAMESVSAPRAAASSRASEPMTSANSALREATDMAKGTSETSRSKDGSTITIQAWNPKAGYISTLKRTPREYMYSQYLELKTDYDTSPSFYMDVADYFMQENLKTEAIRILSNLAELNLENSDVLRALGNKLVEWGCFEQAITVFEKLTVIRAEIPQFYRDLALAYYHAGYAQMAVDTLYDLVTKKWDNRFEEIQQIALNDMNAIIATEKYINTSRIDRRLLQNSPVDIRVVLTWNTDDCDIDLWVTDPDGEKCYYGNKLTQNGGRISRDFTQGYGPEEFCIKQAVKGKYKIEANYYGTHSQKILQPVVVQAEVYTNFGTPYQKKEVLTLQLDTIKGSFTVGEIKF